MESANLPSEAADLPSNYRVERLLQETPTSWVCSAESPPGRTVVVKLLKPEAVPTKVLQLYHGARRSMRLAHPRVAPAIEVGQAGRCHFLAMPCYPCGTLERRLPRSGKLSAEAALQVVTPIARVLGTVHAAGLVHRALTPEHIVFGFNGEPTLLGMGHCLDQTDGSGYLGFVDQQAWSLAPELSDAQTRADQTADVYSLGALLARLLFGEAPQTDQRQPWEDVLSRGQRASKCTRLGELLRRTLSKDPAARPRSAWILIEEAQRAVGLKPRSERSTALVARGQVPSNTRLWFVLCNSGDAKRLKKGDRAMVERLLRAGRITGADLAAPGLNRTFQPLSEYRVFARLLQPSG